MKRLCICIISLVFAGSILNASPKSAEQALPSGPKPTDRPSVALVLAGGGAKGFAHLPVIELLEQMDIPIDMVVGTSIGSIIGGLYSVGYTPVEIEQNFEGMDWTPIFADSDNSPYEKFLEERSAYKNLIPLNFGLNLSLKLGTGLSNGQNIYQLLKEKTMKIPSDQDFNKLPTPFRAVVCDMFTGEALVLDEGDVAEAIRASMSLPAVFAPYEIDGNHYMDGGIRYNLAINVAKNMGYDIIIAIDISQKVRDNLDVFSANPIVAVLNTITISQYTATEKMYKDADLVVFPDISNYGTLDFKQSRQIYEEGKKVLAKYKEPLEEIRKRIYPADYDKNGNRISGMKTLKEKGEYSEMEYMNPSELEINGALEQDVKYIRRYFEKKKHKQLTPAELQELFKYVRSSGNYKSVASRIFEKDGKSILTLNFTQVQKKSAKLFIDMDLSTILSTRTSTMLDLCFDLQYRGLTGKGSVMSLRAKTINDYGISFYYFQPVNSIFFAKLDAEIEDRRYPELPVTFTGNSDYSDYSSYKKFNAKFTIGAKTKYRNIIKAGIYYKYINTGEANEIPFFYERNFENFLSDVDMIYGSDLDENVQEYLYQQVSKRDFNDDENLTGRSFGFLTEIETDYMDRPLFAHKGFYSKISARYAVPLNATFSVNHSLIAEGDFHFAIPAGKHFSINSSVFAGRGLLNNLEKSENAMLAEGFNYFDRVYFPQLCGPGNYGSNKLAASFSFQIEPWHNLTILGGETILRLSGTIGNVVNNIEDFIPADYENQVTNPVMWTGTAGIALKIKTMYSLYFRFGVGSTMQKAFTPFLSVDLGSIRF